MSKTHDKNYLMKKRKKELEEEYEEKDSDRERIICIYRQNSRLIIHIKKKSDFFYIIKNLNMPYFYQDGKKIYFNFDKNVSYFWSKRENKILYESSIKMIVSKDSFFAFHKNHKPAKMKYYSDFGCPYYYFSEDENENFINNLDEEVINELKETRDSDEYKIIKLYGPKKNSKSTIVYYYFSMRRYIPLNEMNYIEDIDNEKDFNSNDPQYIKMADNPNKKDKVDIIDLLVKESDNKLKKGLNKYYISEIYDKIIKREENLELNYEIPFIKEEKCDELNIFSKHDEFNKNNYKNYKNKIFKKEFYFTENDTIGFFRSCYLSHKYLQNKDFSDIDKIETLHYEFSGLFKSYRVYKLFIAKFDDFFNKNKNIIDIGEFILDFMQTYKDNDIRFFIIFDDITKELIKQLESFENKVKSDKNCYLIEIFSNNETNEIFYKEVINSENDEKVQVIYKKNYGKFNDFSNINKSDIEFLVKYFEDNIYYCKEFIKWKKNNSKIDNNIFLNIITDEVKKELFQGFSFEDEAKVFYRYILSHVLNKKIENEKIIQKINLDYFFLNKRKNKYELQALPFIENILKNIVYSPLKNILFENYFIDLEEYIKGGILEDIIKDQLREIFFNKAKNKSDFQEINIKRLIDNEIYTYYDKNTIKTILECKKSFKSLKSKINLEKLKFKKKITILNCIQNAKHYDFGIIYNNILFLFQISINKNEENLLELFEYLYLDIFYIINKLEILTDEMDIIDKIYVYLANIDMEAFLENNKNEKIMQYIQQNKNNNERMKSFVGKTQIAPIYLSTNFEFIDSNSKKVDFCSLNENFLYIQTKVNSINYLLETSINQTKYLNLLKRSNKLESFIDKNSIQFYSLDYPKLIMPKNYILYVEFPALEKAFIKIKNRYYDTNLNLLKNIYDFNNIKQEPHRIFIYSYN